MLGSHDSFTYLKATSKLVETFSMFWRCQDKTIKEQYDDGVRCFDVRVAADTFNGKNVWTTAHGLAEFNQTFVSLTSIMSFFKKQYPGSVLRIVLECDCDNEEIVERFKKQCTTIQKSYKAQIWQLVIKKPWTILYNNDNLSVNDCACHLFGWDMERSVWENITHFDFSSMSIKSYAKKHNPQMTQEMKDDPNIVYFMDYAGTY